MGKVGIIAHASGLHTLLAERLVAASTTEAAEPRRDGMAPGHDRPRNKKLGAGAQRAAEREARERKAREAIYAKPTPDIGAGS